MTEKFFNSRYPIMEALMNGGSDLPLALAVAEAGAFPSYWFNKHSHVDQLYQDLKEFIKCTGNSNIVVGNIDGKRLSDGAFLRLINEFKISHIEVLATNHQTGDVLPVDHIFSNAKTLVGIQLLKKTSKILTRIYNPVNSNLSHQYFDAYCIKGNDSAGKNGELSVSDLYNHQKTISDIHLIPYGGIGHPGQVKDYLSRGAVAVAVGTLFAASQESSLSVEAKNQIIKASSSTLTKLADTNQNSLILDNNFKTLLPTVENDWNRDCYLEQGLQGNGQEGLLYIGKGVDYVTEIRPVKDIVKYLVSELDA
jgi:NAD(P)H-dependent flavin oxidoreductase YrpB (nitropropane dioxygenase family)